MDAVPASNQLFPSPNTSKLRPAFHISDPYLLHILSSQSLLAFYFRSATPSSDIPQCSFFSIESSKSSLKLNLLCAHQACSPKQPLLDDRLVFCPGLDITQLVHIQITIVSCSTCQYETRPSAERDLQRRQRLLNLKSHAPMTLARQWCQRPVL
jgi:hypothetical protein